jgi:hypothetical protein
MLDNRYECDNENGNSRRYASVDITASAFPLDSLILSTYCYSRPINVLFSKEF